MSRQVLMKADGIEDAKFISFDVNLTNITKGKLYEVKLGRPIGLDEYKQKNIGYSDEYYIIDDGGNGSHGLWAFFKATYYK